MSLKERAKSAKTLICFLQSMIGHKTRIDLRNDSHLIGVIESVDSFMNIELNKCDLKSDDNQLIQSFDYFFIKGSRIRFVHIPDDIDIIENIENQIKVIQSRRRNVEINARQRRTTAEEVPQKS